MIEKKYNNSFLFKKSQKCQNEKKEIIKCSYCDDCPYPIHMLETIVFDEKEYKVCDSKKVSLYNNLINEKKENNLQNKNNNGGFLFKGDLEKEEMIIDKFVKSLGFKDKKELQDFVSNFMKYKDEFMDFLNMKENKNSQTISFDINKNQDYINLKKINDDNNLRILELESKIAGLTSNINDNILFKQLKEQNSILSENNKKLEQDIKDIKDDYLKVQNKKIIENDNEELLKQKILYEEKLKEKDKIFNEYKEQTDEKIKNIELKLNTNNSKPSPSFENKKEKQSKTKNNKNIYNSIFVFDKLDEDWMKFISCFTYKDILKMIKLDMFINDDNKINKESYKEVYEWMNIYELDEKKIKSNYNIKRKIKRCKILYNKHHDDLKYIKFNINILSYLKNDEFDEFMKILEEKIKQRNLPLNDFDDLSDNIININNKYENVKCFKKCGNYGHGCYNEVIDRIYCQECMGDGYFTTDNESD